MTFRIRSGWHDDASDYKEILSKYNYRSVDRDGFQIDLIDINSVEELVELQTELEKQSGTQWGIIINNGTYDGIKQITIYDHYIE